MPTNKHAAFRYRVLNDCFRRPRHWTIEALIDEVSEKLSDAFETGMGVSKRTLENDIILMRSEPPRGFLAPIIRENNQYFYADRSFSIENKPLTEKDRAAIKEALAVLRQFNGLPQFQALADMMKRMDGWVNFPDASVIQFETNELAAGAEWLEQLYRAITENRALDVQYQPFTAGEPLTLLFHPYYLREYRNRWFVFGLNAAADSIYNLALDRIKALTPSTHPYHPNDRFDPDTFFRELIGVTRPEAAEPVDLVFQATPLLAKYLVSKPLHPSQRVLRDTDTFVEFYLRVIPNYELYSELARFGKALTVTGPEEVCRALREF